MSGFFRATATNLKNLGPGVRRFGASAKKFAETSSHFDDILILAITGTCYWSGFKKMNKKGKSYDE